MVPLRAICRKCGVVLYEGAVIKAPYEIVSGYGGKCPKCGKKLSSIPKKVEIRSVAETNELSPLDKRKRRPK